MERTPSPRNIELAGLEVGLAAIGPVIGQGQAAAYLLRMNLGILVLLYDERGLLLLSFAFMESLCIYGLKLEHIRSLPCLSGRRRYTDSSGQLTPITPVKPQNVTA